MSFDKYSIKFYEGLKNSQPLAFLASFSIIIGILTWENSSLPNVHKYAIIAGLSFIFSFVMSLSSQYFGDLWHSFRKFANWCKFLFLGIGIVHFILIAGEFGKPIPELWSIIFGIVALSLGGGLFIPLTTIKKRFQKNIFTRLQNQIILPFVGAGFLFVGGTLILNSFWNLSSYFNQVFLLWISIVGLGVFSYFIIDIIQDYQQYRRRK